MVDSESCIEAMETLTAALKKNKTNDELLAKLDKNACDRINPESYPESVDRIPMQRLNDSKTPDSLHFAPAPGTDAAQESTGRFKPVPFPTPANWRAKLKFPARPFIAISSSCAIGSTCRWSMTPAVTVIFTPAKSAVSPTMQITEARDFRAGRRGKSPPAISRHQF